MQEIEEYAESNSGVISEEQDSVNFSENDDEMNEESEDIDEGRIENKYMSTGCQCESPT